MAVLLNAKERRSLARLAARQTAPHRMVVRARLILRLADDPSVSAAARALGLDRDTVRTWRDRFRRRRLKGLYDRPRSGRPARISASARVIIVGMACGKPADFEVASRNVWTLQCLADTFASKHPDLGPVSSSSVQRILSKAELRPHRMRVWLHSPDPGFREKVTEICELYLHPPPGELVLCFDEKPGIQALGRPCPVKPAEPGKDGRIDHSYKRNGTRKLLAAFNPHTGEVYGEMRATRTGDDLVEFMEVLAERHPSVKIHVIWDNLNIHYDGKHKRWTKFNERHDGRFEFHYTPVHASWVNQVELFFGILSRRLLRYGVFDSLEQLDTAVLGFIEQCNRDEAHPFAWKFKGYPLEMGQQAA